MTNLAAGGDTIRHIAWHWGPGLAFVLAIVLLGLSYVLHWRIPRARVLLALVAGSGLGVAARNKIWDLTDKLAVRLAKNLHKLSDVPPEALAAVIPTALTVAAVVIIYRFMTGKTGGSRSGHSPHGHSGGGGRGGGIQHVAVVAGILAPVWWPALGHAVMSTVAGS